MTALSDIEHNAQMADMRSFDPLLDTITFKEGDVHIIYSPSLDISDYGYTESEAKRSFEIVYSEYLRVSAEKDSY